MRENDAVSNSPCGVEREIQNLGTIVYDFCVSNSPCGVERELPIPNVHLKFYVSNSPCGVERIILPPPPFPSP